MARNFQELRSKMSPSSKAASAVEYSRLSRELSLQELRKARELTKPVLLPNLRSLRAMSRSSNVVPICTSARFNYLHAVGAELEIRAVFPRRPCRQDHAVRPRKRARSDKITDKERPSRQPRPPLPN